MNRFEIAKLWQTTSPTAFLKMLLHNPCRLITNEVAKYIHFLLSEIKKYMGFAGVSIVKGIFPFGKDKVEPGHYDYTKTEDFDQQIKGLFKGLGIDNRYFSEAYQKQYEIVKEMLMEEYKNDKETQEYVLESICITSEGNLQYSIPSKRENEPETKIELYVLTEKENIALEEYAYKKGYAKEEIEKAILKKAGTHTIYDSTNEVVREFYVQMLLGRYAEQREETVNTEELDEVFAEEIEHITIEEAKELMQNLNLPYETIESLQKNEDGGYSFVDFSGGSGGSSVLYERVVTDQRLLKIKLQGIAINEDKDDLIEKLQNEYNQSSLTYDEFKALCEECGLSCDINPEKNPPEYIYQPASVHVNILSSEEMKAFSKYAKSIGKSEDEIDKWVSTINVRDQVIRLESDRAVFLNGGIAALIQEWKSSIEQEVEPPITIDIDAENENNDVEWTEISKEESDAAKDKIRKRVFENPDNADNIKVTFSIANMLRGVETDTHLAVRLPKGYFEKTETKEKKLVETESVNWGKYVLIPKENVNEINKYNTEITLSMGQTLTQCEQDGQIIHSDYDETRELTLSALSVMQHFIITKTKEEKPPVPRKSIIVDGVEMERATTKSGFVFAYSSAEKKAVLLKYKGTDTNIVIPAEIKVKGVNCIVTEIKDGVFEGLPIESLSIPDTVTEIRNNVCKNCVKLKTVTMSKNITDIGSQVLRGCVNLEEIKTTSPGNAYVYDNSLIIKKEDDNILYLHVANDKKTSIDMPASITEIGEYAFEDSKAEDITLSENVKKIGNNAFSGCVHLQAINNTKNVKEIGSNSFRNTPNLKEVDIKNAEIIGQRAFSDSGLSNIELTSVTEIGDYAFERCYSLEKATINVAKLKKENYASTAFANNGPIKVEFVNEEIRQEVHIGTHDEAEILSYIKEYINSKLSDTDIEIVDMCLYGSRVYGRETENSDIDVLLEYKGSMSEDTLFNILHEDSITIDGISVDINPITPEKSGTIEEYLISHKGYSKKDIEKKELLAKVNNTFNLAAETLPDALHLLENMQYPQEEDRRNIEEYIIAIRNIENSDETIWSFEDEKDVEENSEVEEELQVVERAIYLIKRDDLEAEINKNQEVVLSIGTKELKGKEMYDYLLREFDSKSGEEIQFTNDIRKLLESYSDSYKQQINYKEILLFLIDREEEENYNNAKRFNFYEKELLVEYVELVKPDEVSEITELIKNLAKEGYGATYTMMPNPIIVSMVENARLNCKPEESALKEKTESINNSQEKEDRVEKESDVDLEEQTPTEDNASQSPVTEQTVSSEASMNEKKSFGEQLRDNLNQQFAIISKLRKEHSKEELQGGNLKDIYESTKKNIIKLTNDYVNSRIGYHYNGDERILKIMQNETLSKAQSISNAISKIDATTNDLDLVIENINEGITNKIVELNVPQYNPEIENEIEKRKNGDRETESEPELQEPIGQADDIYKEVINDEYEAVDTNAAEYEQETTEDNQQTVAETVDTNNAQEKIEDFGEKIGGARKDIWKSRGLSIADFEELNAAEKSKYVTKDNIWKKPDYSQMVQDGYPVQVAYFYKKVRDAVKTSPYITYMDKTPEDIDIKQRQYIQFVTEIREAVQKVKTIQDVLDFKNTFLRDAGYVNYENSYSPVATAKCFNLMDNKLFQSMNVSTYDLRRWEREIEKKQFGVMPENKLPAGIIIRQNKEGFYHNGKAVTPGTWYIAKGYTILADGIENHDEAVKMAKAIGQKVSDRRKKALVPPQLEHIKRTGLQEVLEGKNATGELYMNDFGFKGGEFGNWMSEKDRQASLNMGYEALYDLASALNVSTKDISINNRLSIAFGARGHGNAMAHYEPEREVINLTKMRGAGSLAHEWGHALDFITRENGRPTSIVQEVLNKMKYREATPEEKLENIERVKNRAKKNLLAHLNAILPEGKFTEDKLQVRAQLIQEILDNPSENAVEQLSSLKKQVLGHVITKDDRNTLKYCIESYKHSQNRTVEDSQEVQTDYYKNAKKLDELCSKCDKGFWSSNEELFARAFACYVKDKLEQQGGLSDYLCGHCESCVTIDTDKSGNQYYVKGYPEGQERTAINECFDRMIESYKEMGYLHEPEVMKKENIREQQPEEELQKNETDYQQYMLSL